MPSSIIQQFNGYEIIKHELGRKGKIEFTPINIIYEPIYDENIPVSCYFTDKIHLAYRSYLGECVKGEELIKHRTTRQCPYCENFLAKNEKNMEHHTKICAAKEGIAYRFNIGDIISFQDNFRYLGYVPFTVYFDFETTTDNTVFFNSKMFVVSYCQIYSFHPSLNLEKVVIFWSFQQSAEEQYDYMTILGKNILHILTRQHFFN